MYLVVDIVARWFHRLALNRPLQAMIDGVTAAATGAIAGAVVVLGQRGITDVATCLIFAITLALVLWAKRISEPVLILSAGIVGILLQAVR